VHVFSIFSIFDDWILCIDIVKLWEIFYTETSWFVRLSFVTFFNLGSFLMIQRKHVAVLWWSILSRARLYRSWLRKNTISMIFTGVLCTFGGTLAWQYINFLSKYIGEEKLFEHSVKKTWQFSDERETRLHRMLFYLLVQY
jgi:hypothetical protein